MFVEVQGVTKTFGSVTALDNVAFTVARGATAGLLGPNGSGKTTAMRLLAGMIGADGGSIRVMGLDPNAQGDAVRAQTGVLTENAALYSELTGRENLQFFCDVYGLSRPRAKQRISELAALFSMEDYLDKKAEGYSTGMRKRVSIARALIAQPSLLLLDEPTNGLDPESSHSIMRLIGELNSENVTILLCTHNLDEAQRVCSHFVFLDAGIVRDAGSLDELRAKYNQKRTVVIRAGGAVPSRFQATEGVVRVAVDSEADIPAIVREISAHADVYSVQMEEDSLSDLYFKIREAAV